MTRDQRTHNFKITNAEIFKVNILESIKTILYLVVKLEEQFRRTERTKSLPKIKSCYS